jgi:hypothetical protein
LVGDDELDVELAAVAPHEYRDALAHAKLEQLSLPIVEAFDLAVAGAEDNVPAPESRLRGG